jgi:hypothetical protein
VYDARNVFCISVVAPEKNLETNGIKALPATHSYITKFNNTITEEPKQMPDSLTTKIT